MTIAWVVAGAEVTGAAAELELPVWVNFVAGADAVLEAGAPVGAREDVGAMHLVQIVEMLVL